MGAIAGMEDDRKRFYSDGRCILISSEAKGGGLEEGGREIVRDRRLADCSWEIFFVFFLFFVSFRSIPEGFLYFF